VVQVVEEAVVQPFDVLQRRDDLLEVLILGSSKDGVVDLHTQHQWRRFQG
jgi:hypothetical protein